MSSLKEKILPHVDPGSLNYIIYHKNCADGFGAAYSAWKKLGDKAIYYPAEHNTQPPSDLDNKRVGIFDYCYPKSVIKELEKKAELVVVIDHHLSAKLNIFSQTSADEEDEKQKNYHFDMDKSGARLAWEFFWPDKTIPLMIKYIEDKDLFRFLLPKSKEFTTYWEIVPTEFEEYDKYVKDESLLEGIQEIGAYLLKYRDSKTATLIKDRSYKRKMTLELEEIGGDGKVSKTAPKTYNVLVMNSPLWQSELGNQLMRYKYDDDDDDNNNNNNKESESEEGCDFSMVWNYDGRNKRYSISLRSVNEKADVSKIAKHFGGGGHRNAAGFCWEETSLETLFDKE